MILDDEKYDVVKAIYGDKELILIDPFHNPPYLPGILPKEYHSTYKVVETIDLF